MKNKFGLILLITALALAACSPAVAVEETVMEEPAVEEVMQSDTMENDAAAADAVEEEVMVEETTVEDAMVDEVSFSTDVWPIIEEYALNAHGGKGGVFLESYDDILNYVVPGDPENSMLYKALIADGMQLMPPDGPLPDAMIQTIYDWIMQGAMDN